MSIQSEKVIKLKPRKIGKVLKNGAVSFAPTKEVLGVSVRRFDSVSGKDYVMECHCPSWCQYLRQGRGKKNWGEMICGLERIPSKCHLAQKAFIQLNPKGK